MNRIAGASVHEHVSDHRSPAPTRGSTFNPFCRTNVGSRVEAKLSRHQRRFYRANKRQNQEWLNFSMKSSNSACSCTIWAPAGCGCLRSWRLFCWECPGLMRSRLIPTRSHKTETLGEVEQTIGKRTGRRRRNGCPAAAQLSERVLKGRKRQAFRRSIPWLRTPADSGRHDW